jgi:hypothetical protein
MIADDRDISAARLIEAYNEEARFLPGLFAGGEDSAALELQINNDGCARPADARCSQRRNLLGPATSR